MVIVDRQHSVIFGGTRRECLNYLRSHEVERRRGDIDLAYAVRCENGLYEVGKLSSYAL